VAAPLGGPSIAVAAAGVDQVGRSRHRTAALDDGGGSPRPLALLADARLDALLAPSLRFTI